MRWVSIVVVLSASIASADQVATVTVDKKAEKKALSATKPEPNEYTNDPVLGLAKRINGEESPGLIAFTFDDGPNPATTGAVLDALKQYDIPTTFFIVTQRIAGKHGEKSRDLLARELAEGHLVASHSVTHRWLGKATAKTLDKEMDSSFKTLSTEAKRPIGLFRAPFGAMGGAGRVRLKKLGVTEVFWSIDTLDWKAKDPEKLRKKAGKMIEKQNGGVILFHDIQPITAKIIASVFDDLEARNCKALAEKREPIWPVSLHYFLRDGKEPRAIPEDVKKRTDAYKAALPGRCAKRPPPAPEPAAPAAPAADKKPAK
jgi:peptidoglycan/xylan/chitin deacetylase (PgdA/CDA1 family)